ncbi:MAG TPA: hypothetical protein VE944_24320 [Nostoc sp.]|uniref:hypothetical protein n=1 Tax=Nostoc sp. TaxID=1180 RepID=UPI002D48F87F|nr:hypothetical protein [Nostoc sp.]HYX17422.1 hypothetical protein [Nostoc sp.]
MTLQPWKQKAHRLLAVGMPVNTVRLTEGTFNACNLKFIVHLCNAKAKSIETKGRDACLGALQK